MPPDVRAFHHADTGTWTYLVADPVSRIAAVIDPVLDFDLKSARTGTTFAQVLVDAVEADGLKVHWLLETHAHADHLSAAQWLKARWPQAQIAIGRGICEVQQQFVPLFGLEGEVPCDGRQFDRLFSDDDAFEIGGVQAHVIAVPGHTPDNIAYLIDDALFVGDSLFMPNAGSARCDFPGGDAAMLYRSIRRLYALPDATRVFVCHDYGQGGRAVAGETTIGEQKLRNIHVRDGSSEAEFVAMREARDATLAVPTLILPALQVNLRAGALPEAAANGIRYLRLPLDAL